MSERWRNDYFGIARGEDWFVCRASRTTPLVNCVTAVFGNSESKDRDYRLRLREIPMLAIKSVLAVRPATCRTDRQRFRFAQKLYCHFSPADSCGFASKSCRKSLVFGLRRQVLKISLCFLGRSPLSASDLHTPQAAVSKNRNVASGISPDSGLRI